MIARDLRARAPELSGTRLETIPNPVDVAGLRAADATPRPLEAPYALYVGKLAPNKGVTHLVPTIDRAGLDLPLVIVGEGPERAALERAALERAVLERAVLERAVLETRGGALRA